MNCFSQEGPKIWLYNQNVEGFFGHFSLSIGHWWWANWKTHIIAFRKGKLCTFIETDTAMGDPRISTGSAMLMRVWGFTWNAFTGSIFARCQLFLALEKRAVGVVWGTERKSYFFLALFATLLLRFSPGIIASEVKKGDSKSFIFLRSSWFILYFLTIFALAPR